MRVIRQIFFKQTNNLLLLISNKCPYIANIIYFRSYL